jgi:hypothetical protein
MAQHDFWLSFRVGEAKLQRLETKIASMQDALDGYAAAGETGDWIKATGRALARAEQSRKDRCYDRAWEHLHEARQEEVLGYGDERVRVTAATLHSEATSKLASWRQGSAVEHLAPLLNCQNPGKEERMKLREAMKIRDEHYDNQYFKLRLVQKQVSLLLWMLLCLLLLFALLFYLRHSDLTSVKAVISPAKLVAGILVGAIGACFSGLLSLVATSPTGTIPERVASTTITFARPAIGAVSGFAAILLLSAGLLGELPATTILAFAFAFGFSERLAIGALEKVTPH